MKVFSVKIPISENGQYVSKKKFPEIDFISFCGCFGLDFFKSFGQLCVYFIASYNKMLYIMNYYFLICLFSFIFFKITFTGTGYNPGGSVTAPAVCSGERQFTVTPVPSANPAGNSAASNETSAASLITGNGNNISDQVVHPAAHRPQQRSRPLTGESGASSSSATPSLKSMEQSSQDSAEDASSEDDTGSEVVDFYKVGVSGGENTTGNNSPSLKNSSNHQKHLKIRSTTTNNRANNTTSSGRPNVLPTVPQTAVSTNQQPQSTWI